ncbi:MAG: hypothetical protein ACTSPD_08960 [Promethearchaeota archaeon]
MLKSIIKNFKTKLFFVNISKENNNIFSWKSKYSLKHHFFDINSVKNIGQLKKNIFLHLNKGDIKIVFTKQHKLIFIIGADIQIQFQMLEAFLEYLMEKFIERYRNVLNGFRTGANNIFQDFSNTIESALDNLNNLDLVFFKDVYCTVCKKIHYLAIKKSLIENADETKTIIPLVYYHDGVSLLIYIDKQYDIRGVEIVSLSG